MKRRTALMALGALICEPLAAQEKRPAKVWRVGILRPGPDDSAFRENFATFGPALSAVGMIEGKNLTLDYRVRPGTPQQMLAMANELVDAKVDAILAIAGPSVTAAAKATRTIPIVAVDLESDPVGQKLAVSLRRPGGNITGMFLDFPELSGKWVELLNGVLPKLSHAAVFWDPAVGPYLIKGAEAAGTSMNVQLTRHEVPDPAQFEMAFRAAADQKAQAVLVLSSPQFASARKQIAALALKYRFPSIMPFPNFADVGGLMGYGPRLTSMFRQAGEVMGKILNGSRPAEMPIERPSSFELAVNVSTAKALGLKLPQSLLVRADRVVE